MGFRTDEIRYEMEMLFELEGQREADKFFEYVTENDLVPDFMSNSKEVLAHYDELQKEHAEDEEENIEDGEARMNEFLESMATGKKSYQMGCDFKGIKQIREYEDDDMFIPSSYLCVLKCFNKYFSNLFGTPYEIKLTKPFEYISKYAMSLTEARSIFDEDKNINPITGKKISKLDLPGFFKRGKNGHPVRIQSDNKSSAMAGILCVPMKEAKLLHAVLVYFCRKELRKDVGKRRDLKRIDWDRVVSKIEIYQDKDLTIEQKNIPKIHKKKNNRLTVTWDVETMVEIDGKKQKLIPIAIGFKFIDLHNPEVNDEAEIIFGEDCFTRFLTRVHEIHTDFVQKFSGKQRKIAEKVSIMLYAHNGGRFDNQFLKAISDPTVKFLEQINGGGSQIKRLILEKAGKNVVTKMVFTDSLPFSLSSLDQLGKTLKIKRPKMEFDIVGKDREWYTNNQDHWKPYLTRDVLALEECVISLDKKYHEFGECMNEHFGVASIAWALMCKTSYKIEDMTIPSHPVTRKFIRDSIYGGRTIHWKKYFNKGPHKCEDKLISLDANSLYPTAMAKGAYPSGHYSLLENLEVEAVTNKIMKGFLLIAEVTLDAGNVRFPLVPYKDGDGNLLYLANEFTGVYNSVDIMEALNMGYTLKKVHRGIWWAVSRKYFSRMVPALYGDRQKYKKEENNLEYVLKILLNSMYGKYLEHIKTSISFSDSCLNDFTKECLRMRKLPNGQNEYSLREYYPPERKPAYVGSFILSYARAIVNREILAIGPENIWYGDTDSLYTTLEASKRCRNLHNELGGFKNDYGENVFIDRAIFLDIKRYFLHIAGKDSITVKFNGIDFMDKKGKNLIFDSNKDFGGDKADYIENEIFLKTARGEPILKLGAERWYRALGTVTICRKDMQFQINPNKRAEWKGDEYYPLQYNHKKDERIIALGNLNPFEQVASILPNYDMTIHGINSKLPLMVEKGSSYKVSGEQMKNLNIKLPHMIGSDGTIYKKTKDAIVRCGKYGIDNTKYETPEDLSYLFWMEFKANDLMPNEIITRAQVNEYLHKTLKRLCAHTAKLETRTHTPA
jgi:hypothetical protein